MAPNGLSNVHLGQFTLSSSGGSSICGGAAPPAPGLLAAVGSVTWDADGLATAAGVVVADVALGAPWPPTALACVDRLFWHVATTSATNAAASSGAVLCGDGALPPALG